MHNFLQLLASQQFSPFSILFYAYREKLYHRYKKKYLIFIISNLIIHLEEVNRCARIINKIMKIILVTFKIISISSRMLA